MPVRIREPGGCSGHEAVACSMRGGGSSDRVVAACQEEAVAQENLEGSSSLE